MKCAPEESLRSRGPGCMSVKIGTPKSDRRTLAYFGSNEVALANRRKENSRSAPGSNILQKKRGRTGIAQGVSMFLQLDPRICSIAPQRSIEWVAIQSLSVKVCGFLKLVGCRTKGVRKKVLNYRLHFHSEVKIPDVEILRKKTGYHAPMKALLASALMMAASCLSSSVRSARVRLKSSDDGTGEGGVNSPPTEEVSESLIGDKRTQISSRDKRSNADKWEKSRNTRG